MSERILFLTGRLAETGLQSTLQSIESRNFEYEIRQIGVSVAALMTAEMVKRRLKNWDGFDLIMLPGLCAGNANELTEYYGIKVVKGPNEVNDLPEYFGSPARSVSLDEHSVKLFAEIVDAPQLSVEQIVAVAHTYRDSGADVIDLGCLPSQSFPHLEDAIKALKGGGFEVSVDSLDTNELLRGGHAGADYLLSLNHSTLWIANEVESIPVLIPDEETGLESLYAAVEAMQTKGRQFYVDSILNPVHFGFTKSISQYFEVRNRYPDADIMIGTGNITELTDADTTGMTALLMGIVSELDARAVLTTQVSRHACSVIRETDLARRIMFASRKEASLPKGYSSGLIAVHEKKPFPVSEEEIKNLAEKIRDPSFRIQVCEAGIHIYNRDGLHVSTDPYELYPHLKVDDDASHAFYLGYELSKAELAWKLGKRYIQDRHLSWGCIVPEEQSGDTYKVSRSMAGKSKE